MSRIGVDVDGVLANFDEPFTDLLIKTTGRDLIGLARMLPSYPHTWDFPAAFGYTNQEEALTWKVIKQSNRWWLNLPANPGVEGENGDLDLLDLLADTGHDVYFITARVGATAKRQTEEWLERKGMELPTVILSGDKSAAVRLLDLDCYIDDRGETVNQVIRAVNEDQMDTRVYVIPKPWNASVEIHPGVRRVESVKEMLMKEGLVDSTWLGTVTNHPTIEELNQDLQGGIANG